MSQRLAPNGNYIRWSYAGADGVFLPLQVSAAAEPLAMQPTRTDQTVRQDIVGALVQVNPLSVGSLTLMNIQATATTSTVYERIVNGADGFTGTNGSITRTVDTSLRLVTLRKTVNLKNIQGQSYYQDFTGTLLSFPENITEADTGNTVQVTLTVYGAIGAQVPVSS